MSAAPSLPPVPLDAIDRLLINHLQGGFPLCGRPFAAVASQLGLSEANVLSRVQALLDDGVLTRFGPLFRPEALGGAVTLAALAAPEDQFDHIAGIVNAFPAVAHNYARSHTLNMWFVVATETEADLQATLDAIAAETGLPVHSFPKQNEYFLDFRLEV